MWAQDVFITKEDQEYYYPTDLLVTGPDIIFFWVARMIMAGMEFMNNIPFKDVYFTSIIRDVQGRKMSKSLGNSPDPLVVIGEYGADALRFTINYISPLGQDVMFSTDKTELGRNFANKIWNAGRFLLMNAQQIETDEALIVKHIDFVDEWITSRFQNAIKQFEDALERFDITGAAKIVYSYIWNDYCDWYIELSKVKFYSDNEEIKSATLTRALFLFEGLLKLAHPFMPFITEELWHLISDRKDGESISTSTFPDYDETKISKNAEEEMEFVQNVITSLRNIRGELSIPPSKKIDVLLKTDSVKDNQKIYIKSLAKVDEFTVDPAIQKPPQSASAVVKSCDIFVPLKGIIDLDVERARIEKEISRLEGALKGVEKKLSNEKFVNNAPKEVVEKEHNKKENWESSLIKLKEILEELD